jgi:hypothetical protein
MGEEDRRALIFIYVLPRIAVAYPKKSRNGPERENPD